MTSSVSTIELIADSNHRDASSAPQKDIVVSIILSESTASLLQADAPNLEDLLTEDSNASIFSLKKFFKENSPSNRPSSQSLRHLFTKNGLKNLDYINVDEVYLAKDFDSTPSSVSNFDDLSDDNSSDDENAVDGGDADAAPLMEKCKVYTRPLLSAKTTAHENKLKCKSNNIYVSILESELTITSSGWVNFCRICHGGESVANLITPCRCRGSIALAHLQCLEEWLKQSANSRCELCQHHYEVIREPKYRYMQYLARAFCSLINLCITPLVLFSRYSIPWSIIVFLTHPGDRLKEIVWDLLGFIIYTPTAIASTYLLMVLCDSIAVKHHLHYSRNFTSHFLAFSAVFGMATIDFTYSSWLVVMLQRHLDAWKEWYQNSCTLRLVLPPRKLRRVNRRKIKEDSANQVD